MLKWHTASIWKHYKQQFTAKPCWISTVKRDDKKRTQTHKNVLERLEYLSDTDDNNDDDFIRNPVDVRPRRRRWDGHCEHRLEKIFRKRCDAAELV